jgi:hypothetical protein
MCVFWGVSVHGDAVKRQMHAIIGNWLRTPAVCHWVCAGGACRQLVVLPCSGCASMQLLLMA